MIHREKDFNEAYAETVNKIWNYFAAWVANGFWWIVDSVENIYINTTVYQPIKGKSNISAPKSIIEKHTIVNVQNKDEYCFKW